MRYLKRCPTKTLGTQRIRPKDSVADIWNDFYDILWRICDYHYVDEARKWLMTRLKKHQSVVKRHCSLAENVYHTFSSNDTNNDCMIQKKMNPSCALIGAFRQRRGQSKEWYLSILSSTSPFGNEDQCNERADREPWIDRTVTWRYCCTCQQR